MECCINSNHIHQVARTATKQCGFNKHLCKPLERKLPAPRYSGSTASCANEPRPVGPEPRQGKSIDFYREFTEICRKLEEVQVDRYIMKHKAKIEGCKRGMEWRQLKDLDWFDYSACPKKYV